MAPIRMILIPTVTEFPTGKTISHKTPSKTPTPMATALVIMLTPMMITTEFPIAMKQAMAPTP